VVKRAGSVMTNDDNTHHWRSGIHRSPPDQRALSQAPDSIIIGLDRDPNIPCCAERIVCDLTHTRVFQALDAVGPIDPVIHLAAQSFVHFSLNRPDIYVRDNVLATSNLVQALASEPSLKRLVLVSSCEVYSDTQSPAAETHSLRPRTPYAASKLGAGIFRAERN
jgi:nucleoside-diphosphate-sugar epimerase